ncbi:MAG TPA: hypothetical protein VFC46_11370, partial [Humisphaera sp.]|nr:hypothetical protein [Humisphaera sp.]
ICTDLQQFEKRAIELANDTAVRLDLRKRLDTARTASPLFDTPRFVCNLERAFAQMWDNHATSRGSQAIDLGQ